MVMQDIYPTALRLLGRPVLVVGGGPVAARRAKGLLDAGASVTVVAPEASPALLELAEAGLLTWHGPALPVRRRRRRLVRPDGHRGSGG